MLLLQQRETEGRSCRGGGEHITSVCLYNLRGPQLTFSALWQWSLGGYSSAAAAGKQQRLPGAAQSCFCLPQLFFYPYICVSRKATHNSDDDACFYSTLGKHFLLLLKGRGLLERLQSSIGLQAAEAFLKHFADSEWQINSAVPLCFLTASPICPPCNVAFCLKSLLARTHIIPDILH